MKSVVEKTKSRGEGKQSREALREGGVLPGLFGLEIDRLSLSPNLSISSTHPPLANTSLYPSLVQKGVEKMKGRQRYRETE